MRQPAPAAFDLRVRAFLARLHKVLDHRCFVSGTFVIEIPMTSTRFQRFLEDLTTHSSRRVMSLTHATFQKPEQLEAHRLCGKSCVSSSRDLRAQGGQMEYILNPAMQGLCGKSNTFDRGVMLWYTFGMGRKKYMFLKLERHSYASVAHAKAAVQRYMLKKTRSTGTFEPRRENSYKDASQDRATMAKASARDLALWPAHGAEARLYDATLRTGMEVFVPGPIVANLVS